MQFDDIAIAREYAEKKLAQCKASGKTGCAIPFVYGSILKVCSDLEIAREYHPLMRTLPPLEELMDAPRPK